MAKITHRPAKTTKKNETGTMTSLASDNHRHFSILRQLLHWLRLIFVLKKSSWVQLGLDKCCVRFCANKQGKKSFSQERILLNDSICIIIRN